MACSDGLIKAGQQVIIWFIEQRLACFPRIIEIKLPLYKLQNNVLLRH